MKKYLVIGNPINHSLSPELHNYWIKQNNIDAIYDKKILIDASKLVPTVTWGTSPEDTAPITGTVPDPKNEKDLSMYLLDEVVGYCKSTVSRRKYLLKYFIKNEYR